MSELQKMREAFDRLGDQVLPHPDVTISEIYCANVPGMMFSPPDAVTSDVIIYVHGGAFTLGSFASHGPWVSHLSFQTRRRVLFVDYRLAPESQFPAGVNDVSAAVSAFLDQNPDATVSLVGDSAGGGVIVTAMPEILRCHGDRVSGLVLLSPWLDLSCDASSYSTRASQDLKLSADSLRRHASLYAGPDNLQNASPHTRLTVTFPPTLILVGDDEVLLDDSRLAFERISQNQPDSILQIFAGQTHVWVMDDIHTTATKRALLTITSFLNTTPRTQKEQRNER